VNIEVVYLNERKRFIPEQIAGIMFTKLNQITDTELKTKPVDYVIGFHVFSLTLKDEPCLMQHQ